jgi:thioesterase domain-containing protein
LLAAGHEIGFLGIIDTNISHGRAARDVSFEVSRSRVHVRELGAFLRRENLLDNVLRVVAKELLRWNARYLLRRLAGRDSIPIAPKIRYVIHSWATRYIRMTLAQRYLDDVGDDRLPLDLTLFRSAQVRPTAGPDLGWNSYAATVKVVDIPGDHETLWYSNNRPFLVTAVREVLGALEAIEGA